MRTREQVVTLTKAELAELLFEQLGLNKREAKDMVEAFFEEIRSALEANETVKLSGFGNFQLRDKAQRPGRNPKTGEEIPISARRVVTFHPSQKPRRFRRNATSPSAKSANSVMSRRMFCATGSKSSVSSSRSNAAATVAITSITRCC
ncbi:MAG: integration host factor subunit alpha [Betaproteobacteria bacterium]|nr:integration host factor subunit alpha [Betaproteobacteria bacterium]